MCYVCSRKKYVFLFGDHKWCFSSRRKKKWDKSGHFTLCLNKSWSADYNQSFFQYWCAIYVEHEIEFSQDRTISAKRKEQTDYCSACNWRPLAWVGISSEQQPFGKWTSQICIIAALFDKTANPEERNSGWIKFPIRNSSCMSLWHYAFSGLMCSGHLVVWVDKVLLPYHGWHCA